MLASHDAESLYQTFAHCQPECLCASIRVLVGVCATIPIQRSSVAPKQVAVRMNDAQSEVVIECLDAASANPPVQCKVCPQLVPDIYAVHMVVVYMDEARHGQLSRWLMVESSLDGRVGVLWALSDLEVVEFVAVEGSREERYGPVITPDELLHLPHKF